MRAAKTHYRLGTVQQVTVSGTSAPVTNPFAAQTYVIRIVCTTDSFFTVAASPGATTAMSFLPAMTVEYLTVTPGQKIAFIQNTAGGTATITEMDE